MQISITVYVSLFTVAPGGHPLDSHCRTSHGSEPLQDTKVQKAFTAMPPFTSGGVSRSRPIAITVTRRVSLHILKIGDGNRLDLLYSLYCK